MELSPNVDRLLIEIGQAAAKLNKDMLWVHNKIKAYQNILNDANVGVHVSINAGEVAFGFGRVKNKDSKWCFFVEENGTPPCPLLNCSKERRIEMLKYIPSLLVAIKDELDRQLVLAGLKDAIDQPLNALKAQNDCYAASSKETRKD